VAVNVVELFWQIVVVPVILGVGLAFIVTTCDLLPEQPPEAVTVTV